MYPSYPTFTRTQYSDLAIQFAVPNKHVVEHILDDCEQDYNLRVKAAANILQASVSTLARLMCRHRIKVQPLRSNELGITLFLPPPPCPPPNSWTLSHLRRGFRPQLATILEDPAERSKECEHHVAGWITMYEYLPRQKGVAMDAASDHHPSSMELYV